MAILSSYKCQIIVNGVALQEYDDDDAEQKSDETTPTVVKYVEATSGADFGIKCDILQGWNGGNDLVWRIVLDGTKSRSDVLKETEIIPGYTSSVRNGVQSGSGRQWHLRKYRFADIIIGKLSSVLRLVLH